MLVWSFPGIVTTGPTRQVFEATLDLGLHWHHPATVHIAGLSLKTSGKAAAKVAELLPEGTRFQAVCERLDGQNVRAHVVLEDGTDVGNVIKPGSAPIPGWEYGGDPKTKTWHYPATVDRVIDGDTVVVKADLGCAPYPVTSVRVGHVNAPEHGTPEGDAATVWAEHFLTPGMSVEIASKRLDLYGRILGDVLLSDGTSFGEALIAAGHAVPYEGGPR